MTYRRPATAVSRPVCASLLLGLALTLPMSVVQAAPTAASSAAVPVVGSEHERERERDHERAVGSTEPVGPCETRVTESVRDAHRGQKVDVLFTSDAQVLKTGGDQVEVKGDGRYTGGATGSGAVAFRYTCTFDEHTHKPSGVVFHETDNRPPPPLTVAKADPMLVLPESCETAMATSLRAANPRAASIVFDSMDRHVDPLPSGGTSLSGAGTIVRGPGLNAAAFHYRCDYDANGRVMSARQVD